jgi:hypothetical protein
VKPRAEAAMMKRYKGTVRDNVILLDDGVQLPDGTEVDLRVPSWDKKGRQDRRKVKLHEAVQCILNNPITRYVGIDEIIEENKRELEER